MECQRIKEELVHYLYGELPKERSFQIEAHLRGCSSCREELSMLQNTRKALDLWEEVEPSKYLQQRVLAVVTGERASEYPMLERTGEGSGGVLRILEAVGGGILSAMVLFFILSGKAPVYKIIPQFLSACGIFWAGALSFLFLLIFTGPKRARLRMKGKRMILNLNLVASIVLIATAGAAVFAAIMLYLFPLFYNLKQESMRPIVLRFMGQLPIPILYLFLGGVFTLICLFLGSFFLGKKSQDAPVIHGVLSGAVFSIIVAPGITALCQPLTRGLYLGLLLGSIIGALSGGALGLWLAMRYKPQAATGKYG